MSNQFDAFFINCDWVFPSANMVAMKDAVHEEAVLAFLEHCPGVRRNEQRKSGQIQWHLDSTTFNDI
jgi:hypothetical protein